MSSLAFGVFGKDSIDEALLRIRQAMQESVFPGGEAMCRDDAPLGWQVRNINLKLIKAGLWDHANAGSAGRDVEMPLRFGLIDRPCQIVGRDDLAPGPQDHEGGYGNSRFSEAIIKGDG